MVNNCVFIVKTRVIFRDEINQPLIYPGVTYTITVSSVKSKISGRQIYQNRGNQDQTAP